MRTRHRISASGAGTTLQVRSEVASGIRAWSIGALRVALIVVALGVTSCSRQAAGENPITLPAPSSTSQAPSTTTTSEGTVPQAASPVEPVLEVVGDNFQQPIWVGARPSDGVVLVGEQTGLIRELETASVVLDLSGKVLPGSERGLLGIAFLETRMFVNYTDENGDTVIAEYPDRDASADQERILVRIDQPASNHNGGGIEIGPDGLLWVGMGDGGRSDDVFRNGQDPTSVLGAMLRFDVSTPGLAVAAGGYSGGLQEIWAIGLRNPWRFTFDDGLLIVADVGQNRIEEVSIVASTETDLNFGWPLLEGSDCFDSCETDGLVLPALEYDHGEGCSITGGVVYRGSAIPDLVGSYLYSDYCAGWIRAAQLGPDGTLTDDRELFAGVGRVTSFGRDAMGEVLITDHGGSVFRLGARSNS
ncbi:MAG: PQQ-dependent sugar dehydrogenase [Acidimicrobiia bacterium]|nr:PQQ-dependent sugar dehydrogenase [Acidimicrobiia bacterium]NNL27841.1 glucose dehydrogenase [Acidimicrobiia bacterium]